MNNEIIRRFLENRGWRPELTPDLDMEQICIDLIRKCAEMADATPFPESQGSLGEKSVSGMRTTWMVACHNASKKMRHYWGLESGHFFPVFTGMIEDTGQPQSWRGTSTQAVGYIKLD